MKIQNQTLGTSTYTNDDYSEASVLFWPHDEKGVESALLHFELKDIDKEPCSPKPFKITYNKTVLNSGTKINIEVADNGFIVKTGGDVKIADSEYSLKTMIDTIITSTTEHEFEYDADEHNFENLQDAIDNIITMLGR